MPKYTVTLSYTNLDNNMSTPHQAEIDIAITSDTIDHAYLLAQHLRRLYEADDYQVEPA